MSKDRVATAAKISQDSRLKGTYSLSGYYLYLLS